MEYLLRTAPGGFGSATIFPCVPSVDKLRTSVAKRVDAKIFVFVFSRNFNKIIYFVFRKFSWNLKKFAKHKIEIGRNFLKIRGKIM